MRAGEPRKQQLLQQHPQPAMLLCWIHALNDMVVLKDQDNQMAGIHQGEDMVQGGIHLEEDIPLVGIRPEEDIQMVGIHLEEDMQMVDNLENGMHHVGDGSVQQQILQDLKTALCH